MFLAKKGLIFEESFQNFQKKRKKRLDKYRNSQIGSETVNSLKEKINLFATEKIRFLKENKYPLSHVGLFAILVFLDQLSKYLALRFLAPSYEVGFLGLSLHGPIQNYNLIFGLNAGSASLFFNTVFTAVLCLFLFYYILSLIFIPKYFHYLQIGITILFSGFASNIINKIINGYVIDFLGWSPGFINIHFNLADVFQTIAWVFILSQIFIFRESLFRKTEKRKQLIIMKSYQFQFIGYSVLAFFCLSAFFLLLNYQFLEFIKITNFANIHQISGSFLKYSFLILFLFCLLIIVFFFYLSNKIYGPLYVFERYIKALLNGENPKDLRLRKNDQLQHLEELAKDIKKNLKKSN